MEQRTRRHRPLAESWEYRGIYAATIPLCVVAVALERLSPWRRLPPPSLRRSLIGEARAIAHTIVPHALMR